MNRHLSIYRTIYRNVGLQLRPLVTFGLLQVRHLINGASRAADHLLYPGFRKQTIDRPIFILGNPRSGTTFLHRFLLESQQLCAFELWEMLMPAISFRRSFDGLIDKLASLSPAKYHNSAAHETGLRDIETDDAMAFFNFMDGGFLWSYYLAWEDRWGSEQSKRYFEPRRYGNGASERVIRYLESCWRRNLFLKKKPRILVKSSLFTLEVESLLERYPDCKLLYAVRDPLQSIPSGLNMITEVLENAYGMLSRAPEERRQRYLENLYQAACQTYRSFYELHQSGAIPAKNLCVVPFPKLMNELEPTITELVEFLELDPPNAFWESLAARARKQRAYRSGHAYSLDKFGLSEQRIRSDLAFVYQNYEVQ